MAGQRGAVANVYNGNYAYGGRGAAHNTQSGATVAGGEEPAAVAVNPAAAGFNEGFTLQYFHEREQDVRVAEEGVFFVRGKEASFPFHPVEVAADAGIVGILDHWTLGER